MPDPCRPLRCWRSAHVPQRCTRPRRPARLAEASAPALTLEPYVFTAQNGTKVDAEGTFEVPARKNPNSRKIKISFVSVQVDPATRRSHRHLAGGPGGPGTPSLTAGRFPSPWRCAKSLT
jgi:hypothetical protein